MPQPMYVTGMLTYLFFTGAGKRLRIRAIGAIFVFASLMAACSAPPTVVSSGTPQRTLTPGDPSITATSAAASTPGKTPVTLPPTPADTPTGTAAPTSSPTPERTATSSDDGQPPTPKPTEARPAIVSFTADPLELDPGQSVTFTWTSSGGAAATFWRLLPTGQFGTMWDVPPNGSLTIPTDPFDRNTRTYMIFVYTLSGQYAQGSLTVTFHCPDTYFFTPAPPGCPGQPATLSPATEQSFERGHMIWLQSLATIYVYYVDGLQPAWDTFPDTWTPEEPESDPTIIPPEGFYQPLRGFGKVWRTQLGIRDRLGWALTSSEQAFDGAFQRDSAYKYSNFYIRTADGGVIHMLPERSGWEFVAP